MTIGMDNMSFSSGRGTSHAVVGIKDRETNHVVDEVVERTNRETLQDFVHSHTAPDAQVYTDEASAYVGLDRPHQAVSHTVGE